jgi:hypothetical protein
VLEGFVGLGAVFGAYELLRDAEGFGLEESWLAGSPFPDYTVPGLVLGLVIGGGMIAAAVAAALGSRYALPAALAAGVTLLAFLAVETLVVGYHGPAQVRLLAVIGACGTILALVGWRAAR